MKLHNCDALRRPFIDAENVEDHVGRNGDCAAASADQGAALAINKNLALMAFKRGRPLPGSIATESDATSAMISITAKSSIRVKPPWRLWFRIGDVGGGSRPTLAAIRTE
jgi:hypothetical protein